MTEFERGQWEALNEISCVAYGKQCYFLEDGGLVYSRLACGVMPLKDAVLEFCDWLGE